MHSHTLQRRARGFTLLEILVALVLIGLLVGALLPSVLGQLGRGEVNRVIEDAESVGVAAKLFRVDVNRWPGAIDQLVATLDASDDDLNGNTIPPGLRTRWAGPYIEAGKINGDTLPTARGGVILGTFSKTLWNGTDFLTIKITNLTEEDAEVISEAVDGNTSIGLTDADGRVRWKAGDPDTLLYLLAPVNH